MASLQRKPEKRLLPSPLYVSPSAVFPHLSSSFSPRLFFFGQQQPEQCSDQRQQRLARRMTAVTTAPSTDEDHRKQLHVEPSQTAAAENTSNQARTIMPANNNNNSSEAQIFGTSYKTELFRSARVSSSSFEESPRRYFGRLECQVVRSSLLVQQR